MNTSHRSASRPASRGQALCLRLVSALVLGVVLPACVSTSLYDVHEDMANARNVPIDFQVTTVAGLHFLFDILPLFGNGSLGYGIEQFQNAARERGGISLRIAESETTVYWWVFPPFSLIMPFVVSRVTGDVEYPVAAP